MTIATFSPREEDQIIAAFYVLFQDAATRCFIERMAREAGLCPDHPAWSTYTATLAPWLEDILLAGIAAALIAQKQHPDREPL